MGLYGQFIVLIAICFVAASYQVATPWTPGNLLVARIGESGLSATNLVYVDEITMGGNIVQSFSVVDCGLDNSPYRHGITFSPDKRSIAIACISTPAPAITAPSDTAKKLIYQITSDGRMFLFATVSGMDYMVPTAAFINGLDSTEGWIGGSDNYYAAYVTKGTNGPATSTTIFFQNAHATTGFQVLNDTFYTMYFDSSPYTVAVVTGGTAAAKSSTPTPVTPLFDGKNGVSPSMTPVVPNRSFVYSATEIYGVGDAGSYTVWKVYKNANNVWKMYFRSINSATGLGIHAVDVDGLRMVYVTLKNAVYSLIDDGTQFTSLTQIFTLTDCILTDVKYIYPTCFDSVKNQDESDVDCGGSSCSECADGKTCATNSDCNSGYCNPDSVCSIPSCNDGYKNQDETDVDCGGDTCSDKCADSKGCNTYADCASNYCLESTCTTPTCGDNIRNQGESDVDCGGPCPKCVINKRCTNSTECLTSYCNENNVCDATCTDGVQNQDETGVDCGGATCPACPTSPDAVTTPDTSNTPESSSSPSAANTPGSSNAPSSANTPNGTTKVSGAVSQSSLLGFIMLIVAIVVLV